MSEINELKARIKELEASRDHFFELMAKYFDPPCSYEYGDVDAYDFIGKVDEAEGINWCEEHCGSISYADCWRRFFDLMAKAEDEQMESKIGRASCRERV